MARRHKTNIWKRTTRELNNRVYGAVAVITGHGKLASEPKNPTRVPAKGSDLREEMAKAENVFNSYFGRDNYRDMDTIIRTRGRGLFNWYDTMIDSDALLAGALDTRIDSVAHLDWEVIPASDEPIDLEVADQVTGALLGLDNFDEDLMELLSACRNGYAISEIVWADTEINGKMMLAPDRILSKQPDWFRFDVDGNIYFTGSTTSSQGELMPDYKFIHYPFRPRYQNPYGTSLLRSVYWVWWFKHAGFEEWMRALERGAVPPVLAAYAEDSNKDEQDQLEEIARIFPKSKYALFNQKHKFEMPESHMDANFGDVLIMRCNLEMIYRILGGTQSSTTEKTGSRAQGEVHEKQLQKRIEIDSKALAAKLNNTLIRWIVELNYPGVKDMPRFKQNYEEPRDIATAVLALTNAAQMGIPISVEDAANVLNLPIAKEGADLIQAPSPLGGMPIFGGSEDETTEEPPPEEPKPEETKEAKILRMKRRAILKKRGNDIRAFKDKITEASLVAGKPQYDEFGDQIDYWLQTKRDIEDALDHVDAFRLETSRFRTTMLDTILWGLLNGMFTVFDLPKFKKHLKGANFPTKRLARYKPMPAKDAIAHFKKREILTKEEFEQLEAWSRRNAFTVARLEEDVIESRLKTALQKALEDGMTIKQFQGEVRDVVISDIHAENIFRTNTAGSFVSGNMEASRTEAGKAAIPAFEFMAIVDDRTTEICLERDGKIYDANEIESLDVVPPLHFMCRSDLVPVFEDEWDGDSAGTPGTPAMEGFGRWKSALGD